MQYKQEWRDGVRIISAISWPNSAPRGDFGGAHGGADIEKQQVGRNIQYCTRTATACSSTSIETSSYHNGQHDCNNLCRYASPTRSPAASTLNTTPDPIHIGVIGGTGLQSLASYTHVATLNVVTPWGATSSPISVLHHPSPTTGHPIAIAFLSRHGLHHELAPHEVPARANIAALRSLGVRTIIAFSAVGSLREDIKPRDFVVPDQIIDRTKGIRPFTFFEGGMVGHVGFADPFSPPLATIVNRCGAALAGDGVILHDAGTVVCMEGPQFSTRAESNLYRQWGGAVINMSALPEAKLAKEAEIGYQMICMSTDYDCWHDSAGDVSVEMVMGHMKANAENARRFVGAVLDELSKEEHADLVLAKHLEGASKFAAGMTAPTGRSEEAKRKLGWLFPGYFE